MKDVTITAELIFALQLNFLLSNGADAKAKHGNDTLFDMVVRDVAPHAGGHWGSGHKVAVAFSGRADWRYTAAGMLLLLFLLMRNLSALQT